MEETVLYPSPNWFQVSGLVVTKDKWFIYGGPSKSLCVLEPLSEDNKGVVKDDTRLRSHVLNRAHSEKIVSVDVTPVWPEKRWVLTGAADGSVKLWSLEYENNNLQIKSTLSHDIHVQDMEEVAGVGFSSEVYGITVGSFGQIVKWDLNSNVVKSYKHFLKSFKPVCMSCSPHATLNVAVGTKQGVVFVLDLNGNGKTIYKVRGHDNEIVNVSWCPQNNVTLNKKLQKEADTRFFSSRMDKIRQDAQDELIAEAESESLEKSGLDKTLPEDSFDNTVVEEDDMFDIYKDHEADEFGHKKFVPKEVRVKVNAEKGEEVDFLAECLKLKEKILKSNNQPEPSIESLVEALDNTHVDNESQIATTSQPDQEAKNKPVEASAHIHKHLLASIGKHGNVRIWSKSGKLVGSCAVPNSYNKHQKNKAPVFATLLWYKPEVLLIADGKSQLFECNPLVIDSKNKLAWKLINSLHRRGLYYIGTDAPRVQTEETFSNSRYSIYTIGQDRNLIKYSYEEKQKQTTLPTCGGYIYMVKPCPYDARRLAVAVGDGAVRVWECDLDSEDSQLTPAHSSMYWQNVQGKVLTVAWHPTRENLLAFGTAESRVGLIDCGGKGEKPARVLVPSLHGGVYSLRWGEDNKLYASGAGDLVVYNTDKADEAPEQLSVSVDGQQRKVSAVEVREQYLAVGTVCGGVAVLARGEVQAAAFVYTKTIHTIEWHPQQTSSSSEDSQYKNLMATCSLDKQNTIVILEYKENEDGTRSLSQWKSLSGHKGSVLQLAWSPHHEQKLLSTSQDCTVRVWDIASASCSCIFAGHSQSSLSASWLWSPALGDAVASGGGDCCLKLWREGDHPADLYDEVKHEQLKKEKKKTKDKKFDRSEQKATEESQAPDDSEQLANLESKVKGAKKFLLPIMTRQITQKKIAAIRIMLNKYLESKSIQCESGGGDADNEDLFDTDFVKMFGTINEVNEVLDQELSYHSENGNTEASVLLYIVRGAVDSAVQLAAKHEVVDPFLLSVAPCVSFKYWKDVTQIYLAQIDRLVGKKESTKLCEFRHYGGVVYRKVATLLSVHDIKGAVNALVEARLYKEAYLLCRTRHMDSIAEETLSKWAQSCVDTGDQYMATICYLALGNLSTAAAALGRSKDQSCLLLAAEIAKLAGQNTFAQHMEEKQALLKNEQTDTVEEELEKLPSRIELMMKVNGDDKKVNGLHSEESESVLKENGEVETTM